MQRQRLNPRDSAKCAWIARDAAKTMDWRRTGDLTVQSCAEWMRLLSRKGYAGGTICNKLSAIRSLGRYLVLAGIWDKSPIDDLKGPRVRAIDRGDGAYPFSPEEVSRLIDAAYKAELSSHQARRYGHSRSTLYRFLWETGIRYSEAKRMQVSWVDFERLSIRVKGDKSGRGDRLPITESLAVVLADWVGERGLLPEDQLFVRVDHSTLIRDMKRAGIPRYVGDSGGLWHRFRKGIITHMLRSKVDIEVVRRLARHATAKTTLDHYYRIRDEELRTPLDGGVMDLPKVS